MDPVWVGVIGAAIGGFFGALTSWIAPFAQWLVTRREQRQQRRRDLVDSWRDGVSAAWKEEEAWRDLETRTGTGPGYVPGEAWFMSLSPYLDAENPEVADLLGLADRAKKPWWTKKEPEVKVPEKPGQPIQRRRAPAVSVDESTLMVLIEEIARIEREWGLT